MTCEELQESLTDYMTGELSGAARTAAAAHLAACESCREEADGLREIWRALERMPRERPGPSAGKRFYAMLEERMEAAARRGTLWRGGVFASGDGGGARLGRWLERWLPRRPLAQLATTLAALLIGVLIGTRQPLGTGGGAPGSPGVAKTPESPETPTGPENSEMGELRSEVRSLSQLVTISLLKQESASERLKGVSYGRALTRAQPLAPGLPSAPAFPPGLPSTPGAGALAAERPSEERVLDALLDTVSFDPDVNVRLAAIDALKSVARRPAVQERFMTSLPKQTSPLVQVAMVDVLLASDGARARQNLRQLADDPRLDPAVKDYVRTRLLPRG